MASIKMRLKNLMIRFREILWANLIIFLCLLLLPEKSSMVFINPAQIIPSDIGCPDDTKCNRACQEDPRFNTKGSCVGPGRMLCSCGPPQNATDLPANAESTACDDQECEWKCAEYRMPMTGKCTGGACTCGYNVTITGFQPTEVIPSKYCVIPCCMPLTLSLGFECHDGKVSARKWIVNWSKQVEDLTRAISAVVCGEGIEKNASEKCDGTVGGTESNFPP